MKKFGPYSVKLLLNRAPVFPDCCMICAKESPNSSTRIIGRDGLKGRMLWAGWFMQKIPCCPSCGRKYKLWRIWDFVRALLIAAIFFSFGVIYLLPRMEGWKCGLIVLSMICVGFAVAAVWNRIFPPPFHITRSGDWMEYEFRDESLYLKFIELND